MKKPMLQNDERYLKTLHGALDRYLEVVRKHEVVTGQDVTTTDAWADALKLVEVAIEDLQREVADRLQIVSNINQQTWSLAFQVAHLSQELKKLKGEKEDCGEDHSS